MKLTIEIKGKTYNLTLWLRLFVAIIFISCILIDIVHKDKYMMYIDGLLLILMLQGNEISDLKDEVKELAGKDHV